MVRWTVLLLLLLLVLTGTVAWGGDSLLPNPCPLPPAAVANHVTLTLPVFQVVGTQSLPPRIFLVEEEETILYPAEQLLVETVTAPAVVHAVTLTKLVASTLRYPSLQFTPTVTAVTETVVAFDTTTFVNKLKQTETLNKWKTKYVEQSIVETRIVEPVLTLMSTVSKTTWTSFTSLITVTVTEGKDTAPTHYVTVATTTYTHTALCPLSKLKKI